MDELKSPLCFFRMLWSSLLARTWVSGHRYVISDEESPKNVEILVCQDCGHHSVGWSWQ